MDRKEAINDAFSVQVDMFALQSLAWSVSSDQLGEIRGASGSTEAFVFGECGESGGGIDVTGDEVFHWGSCTKSLSATVAAILVEDDSIALTWETTVDQAIGEPSISGTPLGDATLWHLCSHRCRPN